MRDLPLTYLRALAAVHRAGGIRAGARFLGITHSTVSRQIKDLEHIYGVALVEPEGRGLALTPDGALLARSALAAFEDLEAAALRLRERRGLRTVTIATTASIAVRWLLPRIPRFVEKNPRIELSVLTEQRLVDPDGERVDFAIRQSAEPRTALLAEPLMNDEIYPIIAVSHPDAAQQMDSLPRTATLLHDRDPETAWARWLERHPSPGVDVSRGARFTSSDLVIRAAISGLGYALARDRLVSADVAAGLVARPFGAQSIVLEKAYWLIRAHRPVASVRSLERVSEWIMEEADQELH